MQARSNSQFTMEWVMFCVLIIITGFSFWIWTVYNRMQRDPSSDAPLPPGSFGIPLLGETISLLTQGSSFYDGKLKQHGKIYKTHLFGNPTIRVVGEENVHCILSGENDIVTSHWPKSTQLLLSGGLVLETSGPSHSVLKKTVLQAFTRRALGRYIPTFTKICQTYIDTWCQRGRLCLYPEVRRLTFDVASKTLAGFNLSQDEVRSSMALFQDFVNGMLSIPFNIPGSRFRKAVTARNELLKKIDDCLSSSLDTLDGLSPNILTFLRPLFESENLDSGRLKNICLDLLFASHESTSSAACFLVLFLSKHKNVFLKLEQELRESGIFAEGKRTSPFLNEFKMAASSPQKAHTEFVVVDDSSEICDACIHDNQTIKAKVLCTVCMQYLCAACHKAHKTKKHKLVTDKNTLGSISIKTGSKAMCNKHPTQVLESFCRSHQSACCAKCKMSDHRYCTSRVRLSEISLFHCEGEYELKIESLSNILQEFIRIEAFIETFQGNVESEKKEMISVVKESSKRKEGKEKNARITDLEKQKKEINCLIDKLREQVTEYEEALKSGSGHQFIFVYTIMESELQKYNAVLNEMYESIIHHTGSFDGFESVNAEVDIRRPYAEREVVYLREEVGIDLPENEAEHKISSAIEFLSDGGLLLCDDSNFRLKLFDSNFIAISDVRLSSQPRGIALMSPNHVIVSLPNEKCLQSLIININNTFTLQSKKHTELQYDRLLKYNENIIAHGLTGVFLCFDVLDTSGRRVHRIRKEPLSGGIFSTISYCCLSSDNSVIYIADTENGCIGLSLNGDVVFKFKDESIKIYAGVCALPEGLICVSGVDSGNIVMVNSSGEKVKELVRLKSLKPAFMVYNKEISILVVKVASKSELKVFSLI